MNNKYLIGESVESKNGSKVHVIKDYESFGNVILYYFTDGTALTENEIKIKGFSMIKHIISIPNQEKNRQYFQSIKKQDELLKNI